ncbi:hypothetical protein H696_06065 [Fonticula alba]|uniref:Uncharacterized protein n=1 Tax=Fonticula alba TaxID=691883 RepID=A0A058Z0A5_FONAL|nr:hypothetical protein H696_06065 [Fonticula alba]KCV67546.1 hypothetical protein H696_06065 [Fonticula alba]|eukprot:XP_009498107.1 hypothetical protein H696_06065 [Fonticula alba]
MPDPIRAACPTAPGPGAGPPRHGHHPAPGSEPSATLTMPHRGRAGAMASPALERGPPLGRPCRAGPTKARGGARLQPKRRAPRLAHTAAGLAAQVAP